jgi:NADPH:quinone reductase-like Zn-dependent oxidoreductase
MTTPTMKAVRIYDYGGPEVMRIDEVERPVPGAGEVLVRVVAAGVNPIDWKVRAGQMKAKVPLRMPWIPGGDFSGTVAALGPSVRGVQAGDAVYARADLPGNGSYAEYVVVPRAHVAAKPHTLDHVNAAGVPLAAMTAWQALVGGVGAQSLELEPGQRLLVVGAAGGVGTFAVQLAAAREAKVIAVIRGGRRAIEQAELLRGLGASDVVDVEGMDAYDDVDAVLDLVGDDVQARAWSRLKDGGALASTMGPPSADEARGKETRAVAVFTQTSGSQLEEIASLVDAGKVKVVVDEVMRLEDVTKAHQRLEQGGVRGKLVLRVG